MKLSTLLSSFKSDVLSDCDITGLHNDSRHIKSGDLFIAYPGAAVDGRLYINKAIQAGAAAIVYDPENLPEACIPVASTIPCIALPETSKNLAALASRFYNHPSNDLVITGITGTNGKTTIAYLLAQAYEYLGFNAAYIGTLGQGPVENLKPLANTTPDGLCLQKLFHQYNTSGIKHVCMEVSSHALSLNRVDQVTFKQAVYTNLSHEHLDFHLTIEAYAKEKSKLFAMPDLNYAIINQDDDYAELMSESRMPTCKKITYGIQSSCDIKAFNCKLSMTGSEFDVISPWGNHSLQVNILGTFNIYNSLAVFASLLADGIPVEQIVPVMAQLKAAPGRMEVVEKEPCVIVDYAHTPDALENVLLSLNKLKQGQIITVFGCGGERDKEKRPMMGRIASQYSDVAIITSDNPRNEDPNQIIEAIAFGMDQSTNILKITLREEAIQKAISLAERDDIIIIAGKGHESYQQIGSECIDFSDQAVVRKILDSHPPM